MFRRFPFWEWWFSQMIELATMDHLHLYLTVKPWSCGILSGHSIWPALSNQGLRGLGCLLGGWISAHQEWWSRRSSSSWSSWFAPKVFFRTPITLQPKRFLAGRFATRGWKRHTSRCPSLESTWLCLSAWHFWRAGSDALRFFFRWVRSVSWVSRARLSITWRQFRLWEENAVCANVFVELHAFCQVRSFWDSIRYYIPYDKKNR